MGSVLRLISLKAVSTGIVAMLAIDTVVGMATILLWPGSGAEGLKDGTSTLLAEPAFLAFSFVAGTISTAVGGAICARKATALPYWNVAAFGVLALLIGALLSDPAQPAWFTALAYLSTLPAGFVGASMALRRA